jgi:hypothetical protein
MLASKADGRMPPLFMGRLRIWNALSDEERAAIERRVTKALLPHLRELSA